MEISFTRGYFPAYSAGIFHFCTGDYLGSISQFLGAGIPAPAASWGNMLQASKLVFSKAPWTMLCPGIAVIVCVLSLNLLGDGLRDFWILKRKEEQVNNASEEQ